MTTENLNLAFAGASLGFHFRGRGTVGVKGDDSEVDVEPVLLGRRKGAYRRGARASPGRRSSGRAWKYASILLYSVSRAIAPFADPDVGFGIVLVEDRLFLEPLIAIRLTRANVIR